MGMKRVLLADDHAIVRRGLREILEEQMSDVEIDEAGSVPEAIQKIHREQWDVLVLDITMPGGSGLDVLADARSACPHLPVLVLSMHPEDQYAVRSLRLGAAGYLTKDSAPRELVTAVQHVLAGKKYISESLAEQLAGRLEDGADRPLHEQLSDREFQVMRQIAQGRTVSEIAEDLALSAKTISTYRARILEKMRMHSNNELMRYAMENGLVD